MKWNIEKKYIRIGVIALLVVLIAIFFQFTLEHETRVEETRTVIKNTLAPILYGFLLAYLLNPILHFFEGYFFTPLSELCWRAPEKQQTRAKFSRTLGIICTILLFLIMIVGGLYLVLPQLYQSLVKIVSDAPTYYASVQQWVDSLDPNQSDASKYFLLGLDQAYNQALLYLNDNIIPNMDKIVASITSGIVVGVKLLLNLILALIISIYVMAEKEILVGVCKKLLYSVLRTDHANKALGGIRYADQVFGGFINGKLIDSFIIGGICYVFMQILGMEYTVLISIIIGVTNVIPYFGPFIGAIPSILILLMVDVRQGLIFALFVVILQQIDGNIIGPLIIGDRLNLSSMWILFAILIGGGFFGVPGMILGAPCFACIYTLIRELCRERLEKKKLPVETAAYYRVEHIENQQLVPLERKPMKGMERTKRGNAKEKGATPEEKQKSEEEK
jgi:predicted PurR-regulated permease PerM